MHRVTSAWLVTRTRTDPSEIPSEQKRTRANDNGNQRTQNLPVRSPFALLWWAYCCIIFCCFFFSQLCSIPDEVIGFLNWPNPSSRTMALGSTQPLTEMSLCGLVVRVPSYRSRGPGFDSRRYHIFWEVVGLERGPLSLVRTIEELLEWKSSGSGQENRINGRGDPLRWPRDTLSAKSWH
jgi:hypothetical protein